MWDLHNRCWGVICWAHSEEHNTTVPNLTGLEYMEVHSTRMDICGTKNSEGVICDLCIFEHPLVDGQLRHEGNWHGGHARRRAWYEIFDADAYHAARLKQSMQDAADDWDRMKHYQKLAERGQQMLDRLQEMVDNNTSDCTCFIYAYDELEQIWNPVEVDE